MDVIRAIFSSNKSVGSDVLKDFMQILQLKSVKSALKIAVSVQAAMNAFSVRVTLPYQMEAVQIRVLQIHIFQTLLVYRAQIIALNARDQALTAQNAMMATSSTSPTIR